MRHVSFTLIFNDLEYYVLLLPVICYFFSYFLFSYYFLFIYLFIYYFWLQFYLFFYSILISLLFYCYLWPGYYCILVNQYLLINLLYNNFKSIFSLLLNFYLLFLLIELFFSPVFVSLCIFQIHKASPNISNRHHKHYNIGWHLIVCYSPFRGLHIVTTLRMLKLVLCFHMTSFNYGAKGVKVVDPNFRCHQSNIISDNIFSVNIALCITYG